MENMDLGGAWEMERFSHTHEEVADAVVDRALNRLDDLVRVINALAHYQVEDNKGDGYCQWCASGGLADFQRHAPDAPFIHRAECPVLIAHQLRG